MCSARSWSRVYGRVSTNPHPPICHYADPWFLYSEIPKGTAPRCFYMTGGKSRCVMSVEVMRSADEADFQQAVDAIIEGKSDSAEWGDEDMREALSLLYSGESYNTMEDEVEGVSRGQVSTQVNRITDHLPDQGAGDGRYADESGDGGSEYVWQEPGPEAAERFEKFLVDIGDKVGLNEDFVSRIKFDVERRQELPSPQAFGNAIDSSKSGVANGEQIRWCVDHYKDWLRQFQQEVSPHIAQKTVPREFLNRGGQGGRGQQGGWGSGAGGEAGGAYGSPSGQQPQQQPGAPAGGQMGMMQPMMEMQKEMLQELKEMKSGGGSGPTDTKGQIQEMVELQSAIEELQGGDDSGPDQATQAMLQELRGLKKEMSSGQQVSQSGDPVRDTLLQAARSGDQDISEVADVISKIDADQDPEVAVKELEKEKKEMELEHKKKRTEETMSAVENIVTSLGSEFSKRLEQSGQQAQAAQAAQQARAAQQQQQAAQQQATDSGQKPLDGDWGGQEGDAQPAGDGGTPTAPSAGESPPTTPPAGTPDDEPDTFMCPNCGDESEVDPSTPGTECSHCDYSIQPCGNCQNPVEIMPPGQNELYICPDCEHAATTAHSDDEEIGCVDCEWEGGTDESPSEAAACGGCGAVYEVERDMDAGGA